MRWSVLKASEQLLVTGRNAALRCVLLVRVCCLLERCLYSWNLPSSFALRLRARMRRRSHAEFFLSTFVSLYLSLCLAVRSRISKTTGPDFAEFPVHVSTSHCPSPTTMQYASLCASGSWMPLLY